MICNSATRALLALLVILSFQQAASQLPGYGSKIVPDLVYESKALSPFYSSPEFAFIDLNDNGVFEPTDPVYLNINPADGTVSENDVRITPFEGFYPAGMQVRAIHQDHDKALIRFGSYRFPPAELRYFDVNGDKVYSLEDPVYLDLNPGTVTAGDIRITGYPLDIYGQYSSDSMGPGSRVRDGDPDSDKPTITLPGMLSFYNSNGNVDNRGLAVYDACDLVYLDTQYPFSIVTINDVLISLCEQQAMVL